MTFDPKSDPRFGFPDSDYPKSSYVLTIIGQQLVVAKFDVLLTFDPKSDPRFGLPDPDYPRSNYVLTRDVTIPIPPIPIPYSIG